MPGDRGLRASMRRSLRRPGIWDSPGLHLGLSQFTSISFMKKKKRKAELNLRSSRQLLYFVALCFDLHQNCAVVPWRRRRSSGCRIAPAAPPADTSGCLSQPGLGQSWPGLRLWRGTPKRVNTGADSPAQTDKLRSAVSLMVDGHDSVIHG